MTPTAAPPRPTGGARWDKYRRFFRNPNSWLWIVWLVIALGCLYWPLPLYDNRFNDDPDNYMRADQVRDWLDGSHSWFDTVQRRLDPPHGADVFSRLVDLPLAGIALLAKPFFGLDRSIMIAAGVVPLFVLLPLLLLTLRWAYRPVFGRLSALPAAMSLLYPGFASEFVPGRIDHHAYQILLFAVSLGAVLRLLMDDKHVSRRGVTLGLALAVSLAIGVECLPWLAVLLGCMAYALWREPRRIQPAAYAFAITAPMATALLLMTLRTPAQWHQLSLHVISLLSLKIVLAMALVFAAAAWVAPRINRLYARGAAFAALGAVASAVLLWHQPLLLQGPFLGFDPWLIAFTKARVGEMQPLARYDSLWPWMEALAAISLLGYWQAWRTAVQSQRTVLLILGYLSLGGAALTLFYASRIDRFWYVLALPGLFHALLWFVPRTKRLLIKLMTKHAKQVVWFAALLALIPCLLVITRPLWEISPGDKEEPIQVVMTCDICLAANYLKIFYPEPQRILSYGTTGPQLVWSTRHTVVGGGIYNNGDGLKAARHFFILPDSKAAAQIVADNRIDLIYINNIGYASDVLLNQTDDEYDRPLHANDPDGMLQRLHRNETFTWLRKRDVPLANGKFDIYEVDQDALQAFLR